ncbi:MAG: N-acetylmuramoyl-L-alanine amidase [Oscillospiraceae bacterium]
MENRKEPHVVIYWDRIFIAASILVLVIIAVANLVISASANNEPEKPAAVAVGTTVTTPPADTKMEQTTPQIDLTVVLDPGHGGSDVGATNAGETRFEKVDNLRLAKAVQTALEAQGVTVVMTRTDDSFVSLDDRCSIANDSRADLFVSLHRNCSDVGNGVEIWVDNDKPVIDTALAENIMAGLNEAGISRDRGVQFGYRGDAYTDYQVNRETDMPSCLVEVGFMTSDEDNKLFDKKLTDYAEKIAEAIIKTGKDAGLAKTVDAE